MGTPDFAASSLRALLDAGFDVIAVYTQPDRPGNRGIVTASPVKALAMERGIPVCQPKTLRTEEALSAFQALDADMLAVVAYGKILPDGFLSAPKYGAVNIHGSLLPKYRGAAPIQWAVLSGDTKTGVTSQYMASEVDSGDIIYQEETEIGEFETSGELSDRLQGMGAALLVRTLRDIEAGAAPRIPQNPLAATFTTHLTKEMSPIDWNKSAREIVKHICGLNPWPVATAEIGGVTLRVFGAAYPSAGKRGIEVICGDGKTLLLTEVQAPGGRRMAAAEYLKGHKIDNGPLTTVNCQLP